MERDDIALQKRLHEGSERIQKQPAFQLLALHAERLLVIDALPVNENSIYEGKMLAHILIDRVLDIPGADTDVIPGIGKEPADASLLYFFTRKIRLRRDFVVQSGVSPYRRSGALLSWWGSGPGAISRSESRSNS